MADVPIPLDKLNTINAVSGRASYILEAQDFTVNDQNALYYALHADNYRVKRVRGIYYQKNGHPYCIIKVLGSDTDRISWEGSVYEGIIMFRDSDKSMIFDGIGCTFDEFIPF
jgi:hypothetical protein